MSRFIESMVVTLHGPRKLAMEKQNIDLDCLESHEVFAQTVYSAISPGTEIAAYRGDPPLRAGKAYPRIVGYCNVAEIVAKGSSVSRYEVGEKILTFQSHRSSFTCSEEKIITKIPADTDLMEAATTYLFHLGYNALLRGGLKPGYNVGVVGLGTLGLTTVALASLFGTKVYAFSNQPTSLELAKEFGALTVFKKDDQKIPDTLNKDTKGTGIDLVVTTSNSWEDWRLSLNLPRKGGTICLVGFPGRSQPIPDFNPLDPQLFYYKQLRLIACGYSPDYEIDAQDIRFTIKRNCKFILDLIINKKLPAKQMISSVCNWDEIENIYKLIADRRIPFITGVLNWK